MSEQVIDDLGVLSYSTDKELMRAIYGKLASISMAQDMYFKALCFFGCTNLVLLIVFMFESII